MNILILSTISPHHTYFINKIDEVFKVSEVIYESRILNKEYETKSPFQNEEIKYEKRYFFNNRKDKLRDGIKISKIENVNDIQVKDLIKKEYDAVIVFGCGKICSRIIEMFNFKIINVHRGIARKYRGLDSDLWAIYNDDYLNIGTTIHFVDEGLDTGDIIFEKKVNFTAFDMIYHLRSKTTDLAIQGVLDFLRNKKIDNLSKKKQSHVGKYYSAMPSSLKEECSKKFKEFIENKFHE